MAGAFAERLTYIAMVTLISMDPVTQKNLASFMIDDWVVIYLNGTWPIDCHQ